MLRVRFDATPGVTTFSVFIERLKDGCTFDPLTKAFAKPPNPPALPPTLAVPQRYPGLYALEIDTPIAAWPDGNYLAYVVNAGVVVGLAPCRLVGGDDADPIPLLKLPTTARITFDPPAGTATGGH